MSKLTCEQLDAGRDAACNAAMNTSSMRVSRRPGPASSARCVTQLQPRYRSLIS